MTITVSDGSLSASDSVDMTVRATIFVSIDLHDVVPDTVDESFVPLGANSKQVRWTLTANPTPSNALTVNIKVTKVTPAFDGAELNNFLIDKPPEAITIAGGNIDTADLILPMHDDSTDEAPVKIRVTVLEGEGYEPGHLSSAVVTLRDDDPIESPTGLRANGDLQAGNISLRWTEATRAASYNVQYARCSNPKSDCSSVGEWHLLTDFTDTVVETGGLADEDKKFKANQLYRVQVQSSADDYPATPGAPNKEVSEWDDAGFVFVYPTTDHPKDDKTRVATIGIKRFQTGGHFSYVICRESLPHGINVADIKPGIKKWEQTVWWNKGIGAGNIIRVSGGQMVDDCVNPAEGRPTRNQVLFMSYKNMGEVEGCSGAACWTTHKTFGEISGTLTEAQKPQSIVLKDTTDLPPNDPYHSPLDWYEIGSAGCTMLRSIIIHESGHSFGFSHYDIGGEFDSVMDRPYTGATQRCSPTKYDVVAMMANYQSRDYTAGGDNRN